MTENENPILAIWEHFDKLQLEILAVHARLHARFFGILAGRLGCHEDDLPNLKFMHAATLAFAGKSFPYIDLLQKLDSVRNEVAHENNPTKLVKKFAVFGRAALGPAYAEDPPDAEADRRQDYEALHMVRILIETHVG